MAREKLTRPSTRLILSKTGIYPYDSRININTFADIIPALIIKTTPVKPDRIPVPLWVETILPTLNNLKTLSQAELIPRPNTMEINSGTTEIISINPLMLKMYDNFLSELMSLKSKSIKKNEIINKSKLVNTLE